MASLLYLVADAEKALWVVETRSATYEFRSCSSARAMAARIPPWQAPLVEDYTDWSEVLADTACEAAEKFAEQLDCYSDFLVAGQGYNLHVLVKDPESGETVGFTVEGDLEPVYITHPPWYESRRDVTVNNEPPDPLKIRDDVPW